MMDWDFFVIVAIGFLFTGVIIGYPLGHIFGSRSVNRQIVQPRRAPRVNHNCRCRHSQDILSAEILEVE